MIRSIVGAHSVAARTFVTAIAIGLLAACAGGGGASPSISAQPSAVAISSATPSPGATPTASPSASFPTAAFADISLDPVSDEAAATFQAALEKIANGHGVTAAVMTADGTWSGATGKADDVHDMLPTSQFGIASVTKSVIAAQVMQLVEAGELSLDGPATDYLPADFAFDTNGATIRQLLEMRAGIPDWYSDAMELEVATHRDRAWTTPEVLALVTPDRTPAGEGFLYTDTNYVLLGLVIEHVRGKPLVEVLRDGVLDVEGTDRLVYQPAEAPTDPMAMPLAEPRSALDAGGGYLPSLSDASSAGPAGALASDSISLARWWQAFCAGKIVSQASLTEMATFVDGPDGYGFGLFDIAGGGSVGHAGQNFGYVSWAGCLPIGAVIVVLSTYRFDDIGAMASPLVIAVRSN
jgi:CubicO group peptidase (beta-lactamase class C family)